MKKRQSFTFSEVVSGAWPVLLCAVLASLASKDAPVVYNMLILPRFAPPGWLFSPVWTVLYGLLAYYNICVNSTGLLEKNKRSIFYINLILNALWSYLFFGKMLEAWAAVVLFLMILTVVYLMIFPEKSSCRLNRLILLLYLLWLCYAFALNVSVIYLNFM